MELIRFTTPPGRCGYIPTLQSRMDYRLVLNASADWYDHLLVRGWRRFGNQFFRPSCQECFRCKSIRIKVEEFSARRGQVRNLKSNVQLELVIQPPTVSQAHLEIFERFHRDMESRRGWASHETSQAGYLTSFVTGAGSFGREFLYYLEGRVVAVGLADVLPNALSSVNFFHDPDLRGMGLGVFSVLKQLEYARSLGIPHQYLGYWVEECPSMAYKSQYKPHEILVGRPNDSEEPVWTSLLS